MVVISIISILAAALLPVLNNAKEISRAAVCKSNLHQIANATAMYANDNKNQLPINDNLTTTHRWRWYLALNPYFDRDPHDWRGPSIFLCPSNKTLPDSNQYILWSDYGYVCNLQLMPRRADDNDDGVIEYSNDGWSMEGPVQMNMASSSNVVLVSDANFPGSNGGKCLWIYLPNTTWATDPGYCYIYDKDKIHPDGVNVLFANLSVGCKSAEDISTPGCDVTGSGTWGWWGQ